MYICVHVYFVAVDHNNIIIIFAGIILGFLYLGNIQNYETAKTAYRHGYFIWTNVEYIQISKKSLVI